MTLPYNTILMRCIMQYKESLLWILDKDCKHASMKDQEKKFKANIDFVHSLGLNCDCVGWCRMDLGRPDIDSILAKIEDFCRRESWGVRAWYSREFTGDSDWFALKATEFKDNATADRIKIPTADGSDLRLWPIKAYADLSPGPRENLETVAVPERFRQVCMERSIPCDFFWLEDRGKWEGTQYFCILPTQAVPRAAVSGYEHRGENSPEMFENLGGMLPRVMELCYDVWNAALPQVFLASDLPETGIVCAYLSKHGTMIPPTILIHRATAELLIREKALSWKQLSPVPVVEEFPAGYRIRETEPQLRPTADYIAKGMARFEELKKNPRPVRLVSEKDALKLLRSAKKDRKEDFTKGLTKLQSDSPLLPYWKVAGSGYLSDEYELLSSERSEERTAEFLAAMASEELLEVKPAGTVIAICPDGDNCLLTPAGTVERWSHEAPEVIEHFPTLPQFFADALQD